VVNGPDLVRHALIGGLDHHHRVCLNRTQRQFDATTRLGEELGHIHKEYEAGKIAAAAPTSCRLNH
jgi:hypothetical protein